VVSLCVEGVPEARRVRPHGDMVSNRRHHHKVDSEYLKHSVQCYLDECAIPNQLLLDFGFRRLDRRFVEALVA